MWDVSGAGAALQEGFQPGRLLGRGWKGVTLGVAPHIPHLYLHSASHLQELPDLAVGWGAALWGCLGSGVWEGLSAHPRQEEGWICVQHSWAVGGTGQCCGSGLCISLGQL